MLGAGVPVLTNIAREEALLRGFINEEEADEIGIRSPAGRVGASLLLQVGNIFSGVKGRLYLALSKRLGKGI